MKRGLLIGAGGIAVIGVLAVVVVFFFLGSLLKTAIETTGSRVTQTKVTLGDADIDLTSGRGTLREFTMGNPPGFKSASAFQFGEVSVTVDTSTLDQNPIVIKQVVIQSPRVIYEIGEGGSNIDKIKQNVAAYQKSLVGGGGGGGTGASDDGEGPNLIVEHIYVRNGKVSVMASALMDKTLDADLPEIHLKDIGKKSGGASPGEVASQTMDAVLARVSGVVGGLDLGPIAEALGDNATGALKAIREKAAGGAKALGKEAGGTGNAIEDAAKGAVKSLLGGGD